MKIFKSLLCAAVCVSAAFAANAQVHRCTDAAGKTFYADVPCAANQTGALLERPKSADEITRERAQAAGALERKHQDRVAERDEQEFQRRQRAGESSVAQNGTSVSPADTPACRSAQKELEFVSSIRTLSQDEKRMRTNAAIAQVNASCGSNTPLMQEPPKIITTPVPTIASCNAGFCYDTAGAIYRKSGPDVLTGPTGRTCSRAGIGWNCQ
ncbi:DUF4124 domain-containing protein [Xanthomonas sp. WHRI 10064A]|uniref:DUF4124 domain-containing protein n=1 Tax=unclassified Xanthomonas TaxID=2643310 RepID=UPI002B227639|nr:MULTISPECIES: DUF4124 domain-containing protein [unclassified Xanthomonas]MEA9585974.1 DUF4124 domain-containing protein [Xanthomonas sp. WHRI 10064B]MEA9614401.1 DUF4124 domain-containing protein [Xanthomonas sp. WHRI 10064A]